MNLENSIRQKYQEKRIIILEYIYNNLDKKITISEMSEIVNISHYHFQRIIKSLLGEPVGSFIIRAKIETAALLLNYTDIEIQDIAFKIGYENHSSLNKIFKKYYKISPSEYRKNKKNIILENKKISKNINLFRPQIIRIPEKTVIYIQITGEYGNKEYEIAWKELSNFIKNNKLFEIEAEYFGISYDDPEITEKNKCRYDACITINQAIKPIGRIGVKKIKAGKFAVFSYKGSYDNWGDIYDSIYNKWVFESEFELRNIPAMEKYPTNPNITETDKLEIEVYLPIK